MIENLVMGQNQVHVCNWSGISLMLAASILGDLIHKWFLIVKNTVLWPLSLLGGNHHASNKLSHSPGGWCNIGNLWEQGKSEGFDSCDRPSNLKLDSNRQFFRPCDREIWRMTLQYNRAPLLCYFKLCASFCSHWWIQTSITVRKRPIWVKFDDF